MDFINQKFYQSFFQNFSDAKREDRHEHNTSDDSLGFGFVHYSLVRNILPTNALAIGSRYGLIPACIAIALKDNTKGKLDFVDANYDDDEDGIEFGYGGKGYWSKNNPFEKFGIGEIVNINIARTEDLFKSNQKKYDYIYIDGDHSYKGVKFDFENALEILSPDGIITLHDYHVEDGTLGYDFGIGKLVDSLDREVFNVFIMPVWPGLALIQKRKFTTIKSKL